MDTIYQLARFDKRKIDFRKKYRIKKNIPIIGSISRYDPTKDHEGLLNSLLILKKREIEFFLCSHWL